MTPGRDWASGWLCKNNKRQFYIQQLMTQQAQHKTVNYADLWWKNVVNV